MPLSDLAQGDAISGRLVNIMQTTQPILGLLSPYTFSGNSDTPRKSSGARGGKYRDMNADYADNEVDPVFGDLKLAILGDVVQTDQAHERRGNDIASVRANDLEKFAEDLASFMVNELLNGGGQSLSPRQINGLVDMLPMTNTQAFYASGDNTTALTVAPGNESQEKALLLVLHRVIRSVRGGAQALVMSNEMKAVITTIYGHLVERQESEFGVILDTFAGVPMIAPGLEPDGEEIVATDEQPGSITTDTESVWGVRFGDQRDLAHGGNAFMVQDNGLVGSHYEYNVDLDFQQVLLDDRAIARGAGIKLDL